MMGWMILKQVEEEVEVVLENGPLVRFQKGARNRAIHVQSSESDPRGSSAERCCRGVLA